MNKLSNFIKSAGPTEEFTQRIRITTFDWLLMNLNILRDHYTSNVMVFKTLPRREIALKVALGWATKRFRGRLTAGVTDRIRSMLNFSVKLNRESSDPVALNLNNDEEFPPLPETAGCIDSWVYTRTPPTGTPNTNLY